VADTGDNDRVIDEFLSEAQEIVEALSRDLLILDHAQKQGRVDPDLLNEVFRGVHTLKGVAGMFGYGELAALAHSMENLLDDLRLGRVELTQESLDVLFEGIENFQRLLAEARSPGEHGDVDVDVHAYEARLGKVAPAVKAAAPPEGSLEQYDIDPGVLAVLTEYEEHRLRTNVEQGVALYRLRVRFSLASIDTSLEDLKARAKPHAEIITYLPSMGGGADDAIDLDVLLASRATIADLRDALAGPDATLEPVMRRETALTVPPPAGIVAPAAPKPSVPPGRAPSPRSAAPDALVRHDLGADALSLRSVANTVRVDIRKLDHLMNVVGELSLVRGAVERVSERMRGRSDLRAIATDLFRALRGFERRLDELQDGILDVRMVPLVQVFDRLARVVRQVAREHGKEIRLVVTGADTEIDKLIVEELSDPLLHLIRNAIDHGIEAADARELAGKSRAGTLALNAFQKGNHVLIEVEDDGAGMDPKRLIETAVERGLVSAEDSVDMTDEEALDLIFIPGFTTRDKISDLSGRGVGMDVVKTNISRMGGVVDLSSAAGIGTKFTITLPVTLAIVRALIVSVVGRTFAFPLSAVQEALILDAPTVRTVEGREVVTLRGATLPLCRLDRLFGFPPAPAGRRQYVVVASLGARRLGFVVDDLSGQQDVVIKALGPSLRGVRGFAGATDLGEQRVGLVLDAPALIEEFVAGGERVHATGASA